MSRFVLIPGAGGAAWYWHRVLPLLAASGHEAVAVDLPAADDAAGLDDYADRVVEVVGDAPPVLVAQSLGGFTAPLVCARVPVRAVVLVNAMIPVPGETAGAWGAATGSAAARLAAARRGGYGEVFDDETYFLHDVPPEALVGGSDPPQSGEVMSDPCRFERWPDVPIVVLVGRDDRLFPAELQRRVARDRLGVDAEVLPGGHLIALSQPRALAERLLRVV